MEYGYAYDKKLELMNAFGLRGFPSALLVDPDGVVVWKGHPGALNDAAIEPYLAGTLSTPLFDWPDEAKAVKKAFVKGDMKKALEAAAKLEGDFDAAAEIRAVISGKVEALRAAKEQGNVLGACELAKDLTKRLSGLPEADEAKAILAELKKDKACQTVLKAQKEIAKIREDAAELRKKKDADKLIDKLRKVMEKNPGTYAYDEAQELSKELMQMKAELR